MERIRVGSQGITRMVVTFQDSYNSYINRKLWKSYSLSLSEFGFSCCVFHTGETFYLILAEHDQVSYVDYLAPYFFFAF